LAEIFLHVVVDNGAKEYCILGPYFIPQPYTISQVSHSWREVALSTPSLWANIPHLGEKDVYDISDLHLLRLKTHLERSRQSPLHLSIESHWTIRSVAISNTILDLLRHCERWSSLCIQMSRRLLQYLSSRCKGRLSALTDLCIPFPTPGPFYSEDDSCDFFLHAPNLQNLQFFPSLAGSWTEACPPSIFHGQKTLRLVDRWLAHFRCKVPMIPLNISFPDLERLELNLPASCMPRFSRPNLNVPTDSFRYLTFLRLGGQEISVRVFQAFLVLAPMVSTLELVGFPSESLVALSMCDELSFPEKPRYLPKLRSLAIIFPLGASGCRRAAPVLKDIVRLRDSRKQAGDDESLGFQIRCTFRFRKTCTVVFIGLEDIQNRLDGSVEPAIQHEFRRLGNWCSYLTKVFFGVTRPVEGISVSLSVLINFPFLTIIFTRLPRGWLISEKFVTRYEKPHRYLMRLHYIFFKDMYRVHLTFHAIESHLLMDILNVEVSSSHPCRRDSICLYVIRTLI
jgi:hypothetical protein